MIELTSTAWLLGVGGILLIVSALFARASGRFGIPVFLLFILLGMLAGSDGPGGIVFENYQLAFQIGVISLVLILFDGGLNTSLDSVRTSISPAIVLSTVGVAGTGLVLAGAAWLLGFSWPIALLLGAIVSSTDAAAVFSVLRGSGLNLKRRTGTVLELESGLNDPVAVILTMTFTYLVIGQQAISWWMLVDVFSQLAIGAFVGLGVGAFGRWLLQRARLPAGGLIPVITLSFAFLSFGLATILSGSGFLAVYLAGLMIGNRRFPYRAAVLRFHDAIAWLCQVLMFLFLGLLAFPSQLVDVAAIGISLSLVLVLIARPLIVLLCLLPFGYSLKETTYIGWVGLRGAVPIILAMFPVLLQVEGAQQIFNIIFFIVVFTALLPGGTVGWLTRRLSMVSDSPPAPQAALEMVSLKPTQGEIFSYYIHPASAVCHTPVSAIPLPETASILLIVRNDALVIPRSDTSLEPRDHAYIFCLPEDLMRMNLLFGVQFES